MDYYHKYLIQNLIKISKKLIKINNILEETLIEFLKNIIDQMDGWDMELILKYYTKKFKIKNG